MTRICTHSSADFPLTKYEMVSLLSLRSEEIDTGAHSFIDSKDGVNNIEIAKAEFEAGFLDEYFIARIAPDGSENRITVGKARVNGR